MTANKILLGSQLSRISAFTLPDVLVTFQILLHTSITNVSPLYSLTWLGNWKNFGSSTYTSSDLMVWKCFSRSFTASTLSIIKPMRSRSCISLYFCVECRFLLRIALNLLLTGGDGHSIWLLFRTVHTCGTKYSTIIFILILLILHKFYSNF